MEKRTTMQRDYIGVCIIRKQEIFFPMINSRTPLSKSHPIMYHDILENLSYQGLSGFILSKELFFVSTYEGGSERDTREVGGM